MLLARLASNQQTNCSLGTLQDVNIMTASTIGTPGSASRPISLQDQSVHKLFHPSSNQSNQKPQDQSVFKTNQSSRPVSLQNQSVFKTSQSIKYSIHPSSNQSNQKLQDQSVFKTNQSSRSISPLSIPSIQQSVQPEASRPISPLSIPSIQQSIQPSIYHLSRPCITLSNSLSDRSYSCCLKCFLKIMMGGNMIAWCRDERLDWIESKGESTWLLV